MDDNNNIVTHVPRVVTLWLLNINYYDFVAICTLVNINGKYMYTLCAHNNEVLSWY